MEGISVEGSSVEGRNVEGSSFEERSVDEMSWEGSTMEGLSVELLKHEEYYVNCGYTIVLLFVNSFNFIDLYSNLGIIC